DAAGSPCYGAPQLANGSAVIRFFDGTTPIGTSRIDPVTGGASVRVNLISPDGVNSPVVGSHGISAAYSTPALEYANSASAVAVMSVGKAPTATSFATGASAWVFGQPVSLAARVTSPGVLGQAPLGTVEFLDNGVAIGRGSLTADAGGPIAQLILVAGASPLTAGTHLLSARYIGDDANYAPSQSPGLPQTVVVGKADTTTLLSWQIDSSVPGVRAILTAMVSVNPPGGGLPTGSVQFVNGETGLGSSPLVCAAGSSGATVCTAALTAALSPLGDAFQVSAVYTGDSSYNGSSSNALTITSMFAGQLAVTNAASYAGQPFAPGQIANVWGKGIRLADAADSPEKLPLPTVLRGTTVRITDSVGVERLAPLFYVYPTQVNILIPDEAALGLATLKLTSGAGDSASVGAWIGPTAPGLFSANASGEGAAAAQAVLTHADGRQEFLPNLAAWDPATNRYVAAPVSMGSATDVFTLVLYGTGIRGRSSPQKVSVLINGQALPVRYAGAQPTFVGLDQVNVDLPLSLANADLLNVSLTVDGHASNTVTVRVKP
ncbi:MAG: Ig-like domain repeat protein, partial [Acidobacteriia bacterium]|nr:Ig-like domain repeat protein [Terriglobia bacterium]